MLKNIYIYLFASFSDCIYLQRYWHKHHKLLFNKISYIRPKPFLSAFHQTSWHCNSDETTKAHKSKVPETVDKHGVPGKSFMQDAMYEKACKF